ncbi:MAG TPA: type III-A CRISPR-associated RAMP protein Csm3 [Aquifex aeolicus]|nr:type III-A CRISPR-associated RAMP protein Csm3 [Aquifex aeolicus]
MFKYKGSFVIDYTLTNLTGLRIGGAKEEFDIGGVDNPVIKVPVSIPGFYDDGSDLPQGAPYIPGSSIKGKVRSLLEWALGRVEKMYEKAEEEGKEDKIDFAGRPCTCGECEVCIIFGTGDAKTYDRLKKEGKKLPGPPRAKFFDAYPTKETLERLSEQLGEGIFTEIKTENQINRITSKANPRKVERVPAGAEFRGRIVVDLFREEDEKLLKTLFKGLEMLENNFLGGYGSRGSGRVKFKELVIEFIPRNYYTGDGKKKEVGKYNSVQEIIDKFEEIIKNV